MELTADVLRTTGKTALAAAVLIGLAVGVARADTVGSTAMRAEDVILECAKVAGHSEFGTLYVEFFQFDINEDAGGELDNELELRFDGWVQVRNLDPSQPNQWGDLLCERDFAWGRDVPELNIIYGGYYVYPTKRRIVVRNVPRDSMIRFSLDLNEEDSGGIYDDDGIDFNPYGGIPNLYLDLYPLDRTGATLVGGYENRRDLDFDRRKRIEGDGEGVGSDYAGAAELTVTYIPDSGERGIGGVAPAPGQTPGQPVVGGAMTTEEICRAYALKAVEQNQEQLALGCGFLPPVWSNDHQMHFDWCMHGDNVKIAPQGTADRQAALTTCRQP